MSSHKAAIHFLGKAVKRLEATLTQMELTGKSDTSDYTLMKQSLADVKESINILETLEWVRIRAKEIRGRK